MVSLQHLHLCFNENFRKLPDVQMLTRLQVLDISDSAFDEVPGLGCLRQLRELRWTQIHSKGVSIKLPSLAEFEQLEVADFSSNWAIEQFGSCTGGLSALYLNLSDCVWLRWLPDLSGLRNLLVLVLVGSGIELGEDDLCMLASLSLLQPLVVGRELGDNLRLDVVRRKVLHQIQDSLHPQSSGDSWPEWTEWEERDLGMLPVYVSEIRWFAISKTLENREFAAEWMKEGSSPEADYGDVKEVILNILPGSYIY